jgi:chemotaxis protein CheD
MLTNTQTKTVEGEVRSGVLQITADREAEIIGRSPGTGLIIIIHDAENGVGGMLNSLLPSSHVQRTRANRLPGLFLDTGFPLLVRKVQQLGADEKKWSLTVLGGANPFPADGDSFQMGTINFDTLIQLVKSHGLSVTKSFIGHSVAWCRVTMLTGAIEVETSEGQHKTL